MENSHTTENTCTHSVVGACGCFTSTENTQARELAEKIVDLTGFGGRLHVNDILPDIRDAFTKVRIEAASKARGIHWLGWANGKTNEEIADDFESYMREVGVVFGEETII